MLVDAPAVSPRQSAKLVAAESTHVRVDDARCAAAADRIFDRMDRQAYSTAAWAAHELHPKAQDAATVAWIFTVDTLNFSFWSALPDAERFAVEYRGRRWTGYWSLAAAVNRALDEGVPFTSPAFWRSPAFTPDVVARVFRSASAEPVPLAAERYAVLREAGAALAALGHADATALVEAAGGSAAELVATLSAHLPSYHDVSDYHGRPVPILKRAQIFAADLWAAFGGERWGRFADIDKVTMFADYRVPQILWGLGCITYDTALEAAVRRGDDIPHDSDAEIELRACSIWAVELIRDHIRRFSPNINAVLIDFYLWDTAKEQEAQAAIPAHRTRSIYY